MEAWTRSLRRAATSRRRPGLGGTDRRKPSWPMAAQQQPSALPLAAKRLLQITRPDFRRRAATCIIHRTAVYGPVRTVGWEGRSREAPPYPVSRLAPEGSQSRIGIHEARIGLVVLPFASPSR